MKKLYVGILGAITALNCGLSAGAVNDIQNLNNRLKKSLKTADQPIKEAALDKLCKKSQVKSKACTVQGFVVEKDYGIVTIMKKDKLLFGLFNQSSGKWKLLVKGDDSDLTLNYIQKKKPQIPKNLVNRLVGKARKKAGLK